MTKENQMDDLMRPVHYMVTGDGKFGLYEPGIHFDYFDDTGYWRERGYYLTPLYTEDQMREYAKKAVEAERALLLQSLYAFEEIANETYDSWTNGAKAQRIAEAVLSSLRKHLPLD